MTPSAAMLGMVKDLSIVVAGVVAFVTLWTGMAQWARAQHAARADQFVAMRRRFLEDLTFRRLLDLLATGDAAIARESIQDRRNLAGFLEEVGLLVNSGLLRFQVARYMFGPYVRLVDASPDFWTGLDREGESWAVFHAFAARLRAEGERPIGPDRLRL